MAISRALLLNARIELLAQINGHSPFRARGTRRSEVEELLKSRKRGILGVGISAPDHLHSHEGRLRVYFGRTAQNQESVEHLIPHSINDFAVDSVPVGRIVASGASAFRTECGKSIGHKRVSAGTLGCVVRKHSDPHREYILSNNHVMANCNMCRKYDAILEPGVRDGGHLPIARLFNWEKLKFGHRRSNLMDAAIAELILLGVVNPEQASLGACRGAPQAAYDGQIVCKVGRSTGLTRGAVRALSTIVFVDMPRMKGSPLAVFRSQIAVESVDGSSVFSDDGDSGALVVDEITRRPVGLLFATSLEGGIGYVNPIGPILEKFGVTIV